MDAHSEDSNWKVKKLFLRDKAGGPGAIRTNKQTKQSAHWEFSTIPTARRRRKKKGRGLGEEGAEEGEKEQEGKEETGGGRGKEGGKEDRQEGLDKYLSCPE